mgnify:CR=1 FL=1
MLSPVALSQLLGFLRRYKQSSVPYPRRFILALQKASFDHYHAMYPSAVFDPHEIPEPRKPIITAPQALKVADYCQALTRLSSDTKTSDMLDSLIAELAASISRRTKAYRQANFGAQLHPGFRF